MPRHFRWKQMIWYYLLTLTISSSPSGALTCGCKVGGHTSVCSDQLSCQHQLSFHRAGLSILWFTYRWKIPEQGKQATNTQSTWGVRGNELVIKPEWARWNRLIRSRKMDKEQRSSQKRAGRHDIRQISRKGWGHSQWHQAHHLCMESHQQCHTVPKGEITNHKSAICHGNFWMKTWNQPAAPRERTVGVLDYLWVLHMQIWRLAKIYF